jgi:hypothetical protein
MPRRRLLDPIFFEDIYVAKLSRDERLFLLGCIRNSDDDGRLKGHPAYLKAGIFMYDDDLDLPGVTSLRDSILTKMESWPKDHVFLIIQYTDGDGEYLAFPNWPLQQKPSHPTPSKLPPPPGEIFPKVSRATQENLARNSRETPPQSGQSQSSLGKISLDKFSVDRVNFLGVLDNEKDLTERLTMTLEEYMPRGGPQTMEVIKALWQQAGKQMDSGVFQILYEALKKYPVPVLARSLVKAVKYSDGKRKPANYIQKILEEQSSK